MMNSNIQEIRNDMNTLQSAYPNEYLFFQSSRNIWGYHTLCLRAHSAVLSSLRSGVRARGESTPLVSACDWIVGSPVICLQSEVFI